MGHLTREQDGLTDLLKSNVPPVLLTGQDETTTPVKVVALQATANGALKVSLDGASVTIEHADLDVQLKANEATATESDSVLIAGTEDGALNGTEHAVKVGADGTVQIAGAVTVAGVATEATLALVKTAVEKVATETTVGDGLLVRSDTAANFLVTDANGASIKAAVEKLATETAVGRWPARPQRRRDEDAHHGGVRVCDQDRGRACLGRGRGGRRAHGPQ